MDEGNGDTPSQPDMPPAPDDTEQYIMYLLTMQVTPALLRAYAHKLEFLRRCSFYIEIMHNYPEHDHNYTLNSTVLHLIDPWRLQRMKKMGNAQVKVQLALLEELYSMLSRGRAELEALVGRIRLGSLVLEEEDAIQGKIASLLKVAVEFEEAMVPGSVHLKHKLISEARSSEVPQLCLALSIKKPVVFDKALCAASSNSVVLHWGIEEQEQHETGEQFKIHYKLLHPTTEPLRTQMATLTCVSYCIKVNNLIPDRLYEFTVKRLDSCFLVYGPWIDAVWLKTI
ncbi:fibronectin type III domain-containing protein 11-like [Salminus brasiliensis]|uniref:fibronectin type III domain-containing protein 11-like n=1 Tax=Salminus brasiliensis TaxID=930266 RepID=UPI003B83A30D